MFVRVTTVQADPARVDETTTYTREKLLPAARDIAGSRGIVSLADRETGRGMTLTFWDTEEAMRASEEAADHLRGEAAEALAFDVVGVDRYEVVLDERD